MNLIKILHAKNANVYKRICCIEMICTIWCLRLCLWYCHCTWWVIHPRPWCWITDITVCLMLFISLTGLGRYAYKMGPDDQTDSQLPQKQGGGWAGKNVRSVKCDHAVSWVSFQQNLHWKKSMLFFYSPFSIMFFLYISFWANQFRERSLPHYKHNEVWKWDEEIWSDLLTLS